VGCRDFCAGEVEAYTYLTSFQSDKRHAYTSWEYAILREFIQLKRIGYTHPAMESIEAHFSATGWVRDTIEDVPFGVDRDFDHASDITHGDALAKQGKLADAAVTFRSILASHESDLESNQDNRLAHAERISIVVRIGYLAKQLLLTKQFETALGCANEALRHDPYSTSINLNRAHALMFLGKADEARAVYTSYYDKKMFSTRFAQQAIKEEFAEFSKSGLPHDLMTEMERQFADTRWAERLSGAPGGDKAGSALFESRSAKQQPPLLPPALALRARALPPAAPLSERDDVGSGNTLLSEGKVDEAVAVYKRCVQRCDRKLATNYNMQAQDERSGALDQILQSSFAHILTGEYGKAVTATDYVLSVVPNSPIANVKRAHALMLLEKRDEARNIYLQHREGRITRELSGAQVVLQDFKKRCARLGGRTH
jgi:tetratricopeptide (TPR) repeat protein